MGELKEKTRKVDLYGAVRLFGRIYFDNISRDVENVRKRFLYIQKRVYPRKIVRICFRFVPFFFFFIYFHVGYSVSPPAHNTYFF